MGTSHRVGEVLQPFEIANTFFSYEENITISSVLPVLHGLLDSLKESFKDESSVVVNLQQELSSEITRRWNIGSSSYSYLPLCGALNPCFKNFKFIEDENKRTVKYELLRLMEMELNKM